MEIKTFWDGKPDYFEEKIEKKKEKKIENEPVKKILCKRIHINSSKKKSTHTHTSFT